MKRIAFVLGVIGITALVSTAQARIITVDTTDNDKPAAGKSSLKQAIANAQAGDRISFNIAGAGPHVIKTPIGGYPLVTKNRVAIDGYSQPGSSPNSNPILGGNNAHIQIVLDSTGTESAGDPLKPDRRSTRLPYPGYDDSENGILAVYEADGVIIRGLGFLGRFTESSDADPKIYCVALVKEALNTKVQGCWFGLAPDGTNVFPCGAAVAALRHRVNLDDVNVDIFSGGLVFGTDGDGTNDVAEFNITMGMHVALSIQAPELRVSGNYFNVFPDGITFLDVEAVHKQMLDLGQTGHDASVENIENGRNCDNTIIGTNGDGKSDANERNIFAHACYDHDIEFYSNARNLVIAGNYFGLGVDGLSTPKALEAVAPDLISLPGTGSVRVGSNGDGKSDDLEGNHIYNVQGMKFVEAGFGVPIVARRNTMVNCLFTGFPFADGANALYDAYYADAITDLSGGAVPIITEIKDGTMSGTLPPVNKANYPHHLVDVYVVDGMSFTNNAVTLPGTYAGSFVEGSTADKDPAPHVFKVNLGGMAIPPGSQVAIAVTYMKAAKGAEATNALTGPLSAAMPSLSPEPTPGRGSKDPPRTKSP